MNRRCYRFISKQGHRIYLHVISDSPSNLEAGRAAVIVDNTVHELVDFADLDEMGDPIDDWEMA